MGVSIWEGNKAERVATALEAIAVAQGGAAGQSMDIAGFSRLISMGLGAKAGPVGSAIVTEKETGITVTTGNSGEDVTPGVTGATVDESVFIAHIGHSDPAAYEFTYDGAAWHLNGLTVDLNVFGITASGTPKSGDEIVLHVSADEIAMNVLDHDYHTPANSAIPHTCTIGMRDCFMNFQFDAPEALIHVVDGLAAGSHFYLTLNEGAYGGDTGQDGTYGGTLAADQTIPAGGYLRHTTMGLAQSGGYNASQITGGKWLAYDADFNQIGAQIDTDTGDTTGTNFGTATASTYQGNSEHVNFTERNQYGNNRLDQSAWLQIANTDGLLQWAQKNEWDFPPANRATIKGFLTGLDPAMKSSMVKVKIRVALSDCDGGGFVDVETYVFPLSMMEVNLGKNNGIDETSYGLDNTVITRPLAFYDGAANADRIKTLNGAARNWFLRGAYPSFAFYVRSVNTSGALNHSVAGNANGFVAAWVIGNPVIQSA